ncbi:SDR family oxidoreductase [Sorangium sp. So ce1335]|uniref:SDR family oxidoreductase n=1 Tax=Sorangium sp. So ce1335 TaxID=3133335 RepID=UPI003F5FD24C
MAHDLSNRVALVTGASRGLGAAIARKLAGAGARVAVNYFGGREGAARVVEDIRRAGGEAEAFQADVRDERDVARLVDEVRARLGAIEVLVLNATGPQPYVKLEELTWRHCLDQLEFFVKSPVLLAQAVVPGMKERRAGRIIQIGSEVFEQGVPEFSSYVSAKGAQLGLTRSWAQELGPWGITVNLVAPGWIPVERHASEGLTDAHKQSYASGNPLRRMGAPDEIGDAVVFLASDAAGFITGQKLSVNGGRTLA